MSINDGLHEFAFGLADGGEIVLKGGEEGSVLVYIVGGKQDGAAG
jgi:hypothetical protein